MPGIAKSTIVHSSRAVACGKVLLLGEHAVVYGEPAIAVGLEEGARAYLRAPGRAAITWCARGEEAASALPAKHPLHEAYRRLREALDVADAPDLQLEACLPTGVGLGSSAALGVATARALLALGTAADHRDDTRIEQACYAWEGVFHGHPSGIDHVAAARGGVLLFRREALLDAAPGPVVATVTEVHPGAPLELVVAVAEPAPPTRRMVEGLRQRVQDSERARQEIATIGALVRAACTALQGGDWRQLGDLMNRNHDALVQLGLSTARVDEVCAHARAAGAVGAKITGGGGGGCIVALAPGRQEAVASALRPLVSEVLCRTLT